MNWCASRQKNLTSTGQVQILFAVLLDFVIPRQKVFSVVQNVF